MIIKTAEINSPEENDLKQIDLKEWPDREEFHQNMERYSQLDFIAESVVLIDEGIVAGGCYMTNYPGELEKFVEKVPSLRDKDLIMLEDFVITPEKRGQGYGTKIVNFIRIRYLVDFEMVVLSSNIMEVLKFYINMGAQVLFDGSAEGTKWHEPYKKRILKSYVLFGFEK